MNAVLFIVGEPGVGKTTLCRALLGPLDALTLVPKPKWTLGGWICAAGHYSGGPFDGADRVPYNGVQESLQYWLKHLRSYSVTLLDGDRFSYVSTVAFFRSHGIEVSSVLLQAPSQLVAERRVARGSQQNEAWLRGRVTKAQRFHEQVGGLSLDAQAPIEVLATTIRARLAL